MHPVKQVWVVTYNFGNVKAGPVIRFMRYAPLFLQKNCELVFITKLRDGESETQQNDEGIRSIHLNCSSRVDFIKKVSQLVTQQPSEERPYAFILFSLRYQNFFDFRRFRSQNIKLIYVSTMRLQLDIGKSITHRTKGLLLYFILQRLYSLMDIIVSSTSELQQDFLNLRIARHKLRTISNGVDTFKFSPIEQIEKTPIRKLLGLPEDQVIFLYVGLFVSRKGVLDLIYTMENVCRSHPNVSLLMVGHEMGMDENPPEFMSNWERAKSQAMDQGWLIIHPFSSRIDKYYQASDAFIFFSKLEGMPNVILESMSVGLPLFTNVFEGFSKDYGNNLKEYVLVGNGPETDAKTISDYLDNKASFDVLGESARKHAENHFSLSKSIEQYLELL